MRYCHACKHAGWDPDGNYCAHPKVREEHPIGLTIPCGTLHDKYCGMNTAELFELKDGMDDPRPPDVASPTPEEEVCRDFINSLHPTYEVVSVKRHPTRPDRLCAEIRVPAEYIEVVPKFEDVPFHPRESSLPARAVIEENNQLEDTDEPT